MRTITTTPPPPPPTRSICTIRTYMCTFVLIAIAHAHQHQHHHHRRRRLVLFVIVSFFFYFIFHALQLSGSNGREYHFKHRVLQHARTRRSIPHTRVLKREPLVMYWITLVSTPPPPSFIHSLCFMKFPVGLHKNDCRWVFYFIEKRLRYTHTNTH